MNVNRKHPGLIFTWFLVYIPSKRCLLSSGETTFSFYEYEYVRFTW